LILGKIIDIVATRSHILRL